MTSLKVHLVRVIVILQISHCCMYRDWMRVKYVNDDCYHFPKRRGFFLIGTNTNVPGLPWRSPSANPSNLEFAQLRQYQKSLIGLGRFGSV